MMGIIRKTALFLGMAIILVCGCQSKKCQNSDSSAQEPEQCISPVEGSGALYERWSGKSGLMHTYYGEWSVDVGLPEADKYLERRGTTPWLAPDFISSEQAAKDSLAWAHDRHVRWLGAASGTIHFPFYPDEWEGDLSVWVELRPKMNPSMAVRFYKPDGNGGRVWSDPLTTDLAPGWNGYRWTVPREYLSKDGMQLMRVSFPGTYFEGEARVSAKFVRMGVGPSNGGSGKYKIVPKQANEYAGPKRVLADTLDAFGIRSGDQLSRFFVVPDKSILRFYAAPGAWMEVSGTLRIHAQTDAEKTELISVALKPGECWQLQEIDLSAFAGQAVRFVMTFESDNVGAGFAPDPEFRADAWISEPEIRIPDDGGLAKARLSMERAKRIVVLAIDNLRADRLWNPEKRRAVSTLGRLADDGILGIVMGESKSFVAMETSVLTSVSADVHGVREPGTHVRTGLTTIAEAAHEKGWRTQFYSTSGMIDESRGFAQGFDVVRQLNKENITDTSDVLRIVSGAVGNASEQSLFYVHLSELRLPHRVDAEKMDIWGVPGYTGAVNEAAMNNIAVMQDPGALDCQQFEAYYDAELSRVDDAIGEFISNLPEDTLVVLYGTHGTSLGESTLGYEQGMTPWELLTPFVFYMPGQQLGIRREGIARPAEISASLLGLMGADMPEGSQTVFSLHDSHPVAESDGLSASASMKWFYRIRREGVDTLFTTGLNGELSHKDEGAHPVTIQAHREMIP